MWYYAISNRQHGPVSQEDMERLIEQGIVTAATLVWRAGMQNWLPLAQTELVYRLPPAQSQLAQPMSEPGTPPMISPAPRQTSDTCQRDDGSGVPLTGFEIPAKTKATHLMGLASDLMTGRWWPAIGFSLLFGAITIGINSIPKAGDLIDLALAGVLEVGAMRFWLTYTRGGDHKIDQLFSAFPIYLKTLGLYLLFSLSMLAAMFVAAIPGLIMLGIGSRNFGSFEEMANAPTPLVIVGLIVGGIGAAVAGVWLALILSQIFYILADDAETGVMECFSRSRQLMAGNKWRLFRLQLLFGLLALACIFTLGIGLIWLIPYQHCTLTCFYESLLSEENETLA